MATEHFAPIHRGVLNDPRVRVRIADARSHVAVTGQSYDVILSDSIHPRFRGNATLYTRDYLRRCAARLRPGGLVSTWLPLYGSMRLPLILLLLGPFVAFFGTGYFSGFGAVASEVFPTSVRATALGVTYNSGRLLSAVAPFVVGSMAQRRGFEPAFMLTSFAFLVAAVLWIGIPETRGRKMT